MTTFLKLTSLWILGNILLAVVMFVGGFDFTFPQEGTHASPSYFLYGAFEFALSFVYFIGLIGVAEDLTKKQE